MKFCYYVNPIQDPELFGGYVPSAVSVDCVGHHHPMTGSPNEQREPWVWGTTVDEAETVARRVNQSMGISEREELEIVARSFSSIGRKARRFAHQCPWKRGLTIGRLMAAGNPAEA
jgi:hypothetical protein